MCLSPSVKARGNDFWCTNPLARLPSEFKRISTQLSKTCGTFDGPSLTVMSQGRSGYFQLQCTFLLSSRFLIILRPKRAGLSDEHFNMLVFLKGNDGKY